MNRTVRATRTVDGLKAEFVVETPDTVAELQEKYSEAVICSCFSVGAANQARTSLIGCLNDKDPNEDSKWLYNSPEEVAEAMADFEPAVAKSQSRGAVLSAGGILH